MLRFFCNQARSLHKRTPHPTPETSKIQGLTCISFSVSFSLCVCHFLPVSVYVSPPPFFYVYVCHFLYFCVLFSFSLPFLFYSVLFLFISVISFSRVSLATICCLCVCDSLRFEVLLFIWSSNYWVLLVQNKHIFLFHFIYHLTFPHIVFKEQS